MDFLAWLESSRVAEWALISIEGYPIVITAHSIGLAVMVGICVILNLRLLGLFKGIPYTSLSRVLGFAWFGFAINLISGVVLFTMEATSYVSDVPFLTKIFFVLAGVSMAAWQQLQISRYAEAWMTTGAPTYTKLLATLSLALWAGAIVAGRLIAYLD